MDNITDIIYFLQAVTLPKNIRAGDELEGKEECLTIYELNNGLQNPKFNIEALRFQLRVKSFDYKQMFIYLNNIKNHLDGKYSFIYNDYQYLNFRFTNPSFLKKNHQGAFIGVVEMMYNKVRVQGINYNKYNIEG